MASCKAMESSQALKCRGKSEMVISGAERGAHRSSFPVRLLSQMPGGREVVAAFLSPLNPQSSPLDQWILARRKADESLGR